MCGFSVQADIFYCLKVGRSKGMTVAIVYAVQLEDQWCAGECTPAVDMVVAAVTMARIISAPADRKPPLCITPDRGRYKVALVSPFAAP